MSVSLDRSVPFVDAVLAAAEGTGAIDTAVHILRRSESEHGLTILDGAEGEPGDGVFVPREPAAHTPDRVRELARSWEQFDRSFDAEPEARTEDRLHRSLWPFLGSTHLVLAGVDFAPDHLLLFNDGAVGSWSPASWARVMARWASEARWAGRDDWHPDHFVGSLDETIEGYAAWKDAARQVIAAARG